MIVAQVFPEISKTQLISIFKISIVWRVLLDCVVGEVDPVVCQGSRISCILAGARPDVALPEEEAIEVMCDEDPHPNVKLPPMNQ